MNTDTATESIGFEPQAFIADPESDVGMFEISNMDLEKLRSGDQSTWNDLAAKLEPAVRSDAEKRSLQKSDTSGFIREIEPSRANQEAWDQARRIWDSHGAISPPFEKDLLCRIARMSGVLQECVRTYCTVIEGFGHMFKPVLDPDADDAVQQVKWTMWNRRVELGGDVDLSEPTDNEVQKRLEEISREMQFQKMRAIRFFRNAARIKGQPVGFINLRKRLRQDYEITGEWYLEILRDLNGNIRRLSYLPSVGMRQMPLDNDMIAVKVKERADDFHVVEQIEHRRFRRYLQVDPDQSAQAYFKEFGDPRILSSVSGRYYQTIDDLEKHEPGVMAATEVLTDGIPDPETPYGVARWTANSPAIGGSRKAEEVNFAYFDNKTIPPFIILVSGGRLSSHAQERIKTYLRALKGSENFHKLLVLEAAPFAANMPGQPPQRVQIEVVPLIKFMQDDGLFLKYLAFNDTRIGANFACPPLLRGRCHSEDTEYLTENGWKRYDEIQDEERLGTLNIENGMLEYQEQKERYQYNYVGEMVHLNNRGIDALVTPNHRMLMRPTVATGKTEKAWSFVEAGDLEQVTNGNGGRIEIPTSANWEGQEIETFVIPGMMRSNAWDPTKPTKNRTRDLERYDRALEKSQDREVSMDLFLAFLGYFVSEGSTTSNKNGTSSMGGRIQLSQNTGEILEKMILNLKELGFEPQVDIRRGNQANITFSHLGLCAWLRENCGTASNNKRLPDWVMELSTRQMKIVLNALVDGDGSAKDSRASEGAFSYSTTSKQLNDQLHVLCLKLGYTMTSRAVDRSGNGWNLIYRSYAHISHRHLLHYTKQINYVDYVGKVSCFSVQNGTLITRRNGRVLISGNSDDYNRATSRESLRFFEKLVAEPERMHFDELLNTRLMMALGLTLVKFESLGSDTSDPEVTSRVLEVLLNHGALLPIDGRQEAERLLRRELPKVTDPFMYRPLKLSVSEMATRANVPGQEQLSSTLINEETAEEDFDQNNTQNVQMADDLDVSYVNSLRKQIKSDLDAFGRDTIWTGIEK